MPRAAATGFVACPGEVPQFHHPGGQRIFYGETGKGFIEREKVSSAVGLRRSASSTRCMAPPCLRRAFPPGRLNENTPHRLGGRGKKMTAAIPVRVLLIADQPQIGFMDQSRWLERLARLFACQLGCGQAAQFVIHQRQKLIGGVGIALFDRVQKLKNIAHGIQDNSLAKTLQTSRLVGLRAPTDQST